MLQPFKSVHFYSLPSLTVGHADYVGNLHTADGRNFVTRESQGHTVLWPHLTHKVQPHRPTLANRPTQLNAIFPIPTTSTR